MQKTILTPFDLEHFDLLDLNHIQCGPGLYAIICTETQKIYLGKSLNVPKRLRFHWEELKKQRHECSDFQKDWNQFAESSFHFISINVDPVWEDPTKRRQQEGILIARNKERLYNKMVPRKLEKDKYQKKVYCKGQLYSSIAEASRGTGYSETHLRRLLRDPNKPDFYYDTVSKEQELINLKTAFPVVVHNVIYRSVRAASLATKIPRRTLMRHLSSSSHDYCFYFDPSSPEEGPGRDRKQDGKGTPKRIEE